MTTRSRTLTPLLPLVLVFLLGIPSVPLATTMESLRFPEAVGQVHDARQGRPLWVATDGLTPQGQDLIRVISTLSNEGLNPADYHLSSFAHLEGASASPSYVQQKIASSAHQLERLLTDAFLSLAMDLAGARETSLELPEKWVPTSASPHLLAEITELLIDGELPPGLGLDQFRPRHPDYARLCQALAQESRRLAQRPRISLSEGPVLRKGDCSVRVLELRRQLIFWGDLPALPLAGPGPSPWLAAFTFDETVARAVRHFQRRQGLVADGLVGTQTLVALNRSVEDHLAHIRLNLERLRWLPRDLGDRHIRVNIPDFTLSLFQDQAPLFTTRAIVGKQERPTPIFSGKISAMVVNPYWNVPQKLAREDLLPKVRSNPTYLHERQFTVYENWVPGAPPLDFQTLDWDSIKPWDMAYKFQQNPGPQNPLGQVKFMFTNPFSVYLHDTNHPEAFRQNQRTLSSGCVRVEDPIQLAHLLMETSSEFPEKSPPLVTLLQSQENRRLKLDRPVPVHLMYLTCWVDESGDLNFREDVYGYDDRLLAALEVQFAKESEEILAAGAPQLTEREIARTEPTSFAPVPYPHE